MTMGEVHQRLGLDAPGISPGLWCTLILQGGSRNMNISRAISKTAVAIAGLACVLPGIPPAAAQSKAGRYQPTSESLRQHKVPTWFEDAKFGIFVHWGVYSVPAYHEWYVAFISPKAGFGFLFGGPPFNATP